MNNNPELLGYEEINYENKIRAVYECWSKTLQQYKEELILREKPVTTIKLFEDIPELELELKLQPDLSENGFATNLFNVALSRARYNRARYKLVVVCNYDKLYIKHTYQANIRRVLSLQHNKKTKRSKRISTKKRKRKRNRKRRGRRQ